MNSSFGGMDVDAKLRELSGSMQSPGKWSRDMLTVPDIMTEEAETTKLEQEIDAMVMATYGGPLIKQATQEKLQLPAPLEHTNSFDSLIGILKALPDADGHPDMVSSPLKKAPQTPKSSTVAPFLPPVPAPPSFGSGSTSSQDHGAMASQAFAPLSLSPKTLASKVEALQKKLLGGGLGPAESAQLGSFSFKLNSSSSPHKPLAQGQFTGVMPWKMTFSDDDAKAASPAPEASPSKQQGSKHLLPERPPLVRGGSFTIKPKKRRRVTTDADDSFDLSSMTGGGAMDDPLIDTYLDICFADAGPEDSTAVLSIDHEEYADLIKAFEIDTAEMPKMPDL